MKKELYYYDIFPKVFPVGRNVEITVRSLDEHTRFDGEYTVVVRALDSGSAPNFAQFMPEFTCDVTADSASHGSLKFSYTADHECEYYVRIFKKGSDNRIVQLAVYALNPDLAERIPLRGDLHMHTCRSDGSQDPATVCANYRGNGYDFIVITDHYRYYPSLEARKIYADAPVFLNILPGEEVHLPRTNVHIVNAGGEFSVNGLLETSNNFQEKGDSLEFRSLYGKAPDMIPMDEYNRQIEEIAAALPDDFPSHSDRISYAVCCFAYDKIREGNGLAIYAHPYWIANMWHVQEAMNFYMMEKHPFDAFEVLGGENYYEQNGFQTAMYYDEYRHGRVHPIVGSTDSHDSTEHNRNALICSTIVFAHKNERLDIIASIKDKYSVAVDTISTEYRLVGEFRYQKYAAFLMENWYPLHDKVAAVDGELMRQFYAGDIPASDLAYTKSMAESQFAKYFVCL